jgi:hypothetical protein
MNASAIVRPNFSPTPSGGAIGTPGRIALEAGRSRRFRGDP